MTKAEAIKLAKRVEAWRDRMVYLGIGHFRIDSVSVVDETPGGPTAGATVIPSHTYDSCRFYFTISFLESIESPRQLDETIIHEWLHVAMRDLDQAIESAEDDMTGTARETWNSRITHEREGLVDRLARQVYALWAADSEATPATLRRLNR